MTLLARLISKREGFGKPGAVPTRDHNPGDLRHSPHSSHDGEGPNDIGEIDNDADGWADLELQLQDYIREHPGITLQTMVEQYYAPDNENDSAAYLAYVVNGGGWTNDTPVSVAVLTP